MKEKHRMIVVFSAFLLVVSLFGFFIYKVSGSSRDDNQQLKRQTKKAKVKLRLLDPNPDIGDSGKKEVLLEIENDEKAIFNLKVEKFKDYEHGGFFMRKNWERIIGTHQVAYSISMPPITVYLQGGEQERIKIEQLSIVWKNENCEILDMDNIFKVGEKIELKLGLKENASGDRTWNFLGGKSKNGDYVFAMEIYGDYEIITPTRRIKFY